ncbi:hypothetical protein B0H11DRAFT_1904812 [Mycena galericulata]|nr:hypothetical protein B0H11DRAFT_1904812 [Mycena galericulata]
MRIDNDILVAKEAAVGSYGGTGTTSGRSVLSGARGVDAVPRHVGRASKRARRRHGSLAYDVGDPEETVESIGGPGAVLGVLKGVGALKGISARDNARGLRWPVTAGPRDARERADLVVARERRGKYVWLVKMLGSPVGQLLLGDNEGAPVEGNQRVARRGQRQNALGPGERCRGRVASKGITAGCEQFGGSPTRASGSLGWQTRRSRAELLGIICSWREWNLRNFIQLNRYVVVTYLLPTDDTV